MSTIDEIQNDLACPSCQYNLRGLHGAIVNCPECGFSIDVAKLIATRWVGPWDKAPGYGSVQFPALMSLLVMVPIAFVVPGLLSSRITLIEVLLVGVPLAISLTCVVRVCQRFGVMEGIKLIAYAHVLLGAYVVGIFGAIGTFALFVSEQNPALLFFTALSVAVFVGCRRIDRILAEGCIRHYLQEQAKTR